MSTSKPKRIQLSRKKGWRKPEGAVVVSRPSKWGNPYTIAGLREMGREESTEDLRAESVFFFKSWLNGVEWGATAERDLILADLDQLRGHDLACWCPLDQPCHADVLLELANALQPQKQTEDR